MLHISNVTILENDSNFTRCGYSFNFHRTSWDTHLKDNVTHHRIGMKSSELLNKMAENE